MTDLTIQIKIAEACGWTRLHLDEGILRGRPPSERCEGNGGWEVPDFCNDLNAMRSAEAMMNFAECNRFTKHLREIGDANAEFMGHEAENFDWHSTARQRAEAFLRTLDLWEEEGDNREP